MTHERNPNIRPFSTEYVNGIITIVRNAATESAMSLPNGMFFASSIIIRPTQMRAGVVANIGIARNTGEKNSAAMNSSPVVTDVRPVLPPLATPVLDSIIAVFIYQICLRRNADQSSNCIEEIDEKKRECDRSESHYMVQRPSEVEIEHMLVDRDETSGEYRIQ